MTTPAPTDAEAVLFRAIVEYGHVRERAPEDSVTRDRLAGAVNESIVDLESAIRTERDTAWRAAIDDLRCGVVCPPEARCAACRESGQWNAALSVLADRMGAE